MTSLRIKHQHTKISIQFYNTTFSNIGKFYPLTSGQAVVCYSQNPTFQVDYSTHCGPVQLSLCSGNCWHNGQKCIYTHGLSCLLGQLVDIKLSLIRTELLIFLQNLFYSFCTINDDFMLSFSHHKGSAVIFYFASQFPYRRWQWYYPGLFFFLFPSKNLHPGFSFQNPL